jgi:hypothetical protein
MKRSEATNDFPEARENLWKLVVSPTIWAGHFLLSYCTAAVWCAKLAGPDGSLGAARVLIALYTIIALAAIAAVGVNAWRRHRAGESTPPHDFDSPGDRHRFLGFANLLLSGLSAVAVSYAALAIVFFESCR